MPVLGRAVGGSRVQRLSQETSAVAIGLTLHTGRNRAGATVVTGAPGNGAQAKDALCTTSASVLLESVV